MRVGLFVPCYVDQLTPRVGLATLEVLARCGVEVEFPGGQTCCGQPMANMGCGADARALAVRYAEVFADYDYVVCPSGSCTAMVRHHYPELYAGTAAQRAVWSRTYELCEFLTAFADLDRIRGSFPYRVGLHRGCHGLRELRLGACSELVHERGDTVAQLLRRLDGLELIELERADECCGFGGTFSVDEPGVSALMGRDRIRDHRRAGAQVIASTDVSCLMHLDGLLRRQRSAEKVMHVAEILAAAGQ